MTFLLQPVGLVNNAAHCQQNQVLSGHCGQIEFVKESDLNRVCLQSEHSFQNPSLSDVTDNLLCQDPHKCIIVASSHRER